MSIWDAFGKGRYKGFSREAGQLLDKAVELAGGLGCKKADTGHLLWAMLQADGGPAARFLAGKNISELEVRRQLSAGRDGSVTRLARGDMAADLRRAMDYAIIGAQNAHLSRAEPEHLLCAMLEDTDCAAGVMLASMGVQLTEAVRECRQLSGQFILPIQPRSASLPRGSRASDKYCRDLTRRAADGELDPVFCREKELDRMVEILCRRQKNNPCLVGEPGVGKTALAEGLAQRIADKQVPRMLQGRRLLALDMASLVAGTKYRGDFEERFKNLLEIQHSKETVIQDRTIFEGVYVFAANNRKMGNMDQRDYETYMELFESMMEVVEMPELMIYLRSSVPHLVKNIQKRGRDYEQKMPLDYLAPGNTACCPPGSTQKPTICGGSSASPPAFTSPWCGTSCSAGTSSPPTGCAFRPWPLPKTSSSTPPTCTTPKGPSSLLRSPATAMCRTPRASATPRSPSAPCWSTGNACTASTARCAGKWACMKNTAPGCGASTSACSKAPCPAARCRSWPIPLPAPKACADVERSFYGVSSREHPCAHV